MTKLGYLVTTTYQQDFYAWVTKNVRVFHTREQAFKYVDDEAVKYPEVTYRVTPVDIEEEDNSNEENLKSKQKLEAIRTTIVDVFDKNTNCEAYLYYYALSHIEKILREDNDGLEYSRKS